MGRWEDLSTDQQRALKDAIFVDVVDYEVYANYHELLANDDGITASQFWRERAKSLREAWQILTGKELPEPVQEQART